MTNLDFIVLNYNALLVSSKSTALGGKAHKHDFT